MRAGALAFSLLSAGCGDPIVVLGDAPGFMRVVAGVPDSAGERIDTLALRTRLTEPSAVAFDAERSLLYVVDRGARRQQGGITQPVARIMSVDSRTRLRLLVDGGGCAGEICLHAAAQMQRAGDGTFLISDRVGHRVLRFDPATLALDVVAGTGMDAFTPDGAPASGAGLRRPAGVAQDDNGIIYIAEQGSSRVRFIAPDGTLGTIAGNGISGYSGDGGLATDARLALPAGLAVTGRTLYIADSGTHTVRAVNLDDRNITTVAGTGGPGFGGDGGPAVLGQLNVPVGLTLSADGALLFISDRENHRVRVVNLAAGTIATFAGSGSPVFSGSRGPAGEVSLRWPTGLATGDRGFLYIADTGHHVSWRATLTF